MGKKNKALKFFNIFLISILSIGVATSVGLTSYFLIGNAFDNGTENQNSGFEYTNTITNFQKSAKFYNNSEISSAEREAATKDKKALDFYVANTRSIAIQRKGTNEATIGTAWAYPNPNHDGRYWFATNIHVIRDIIGLTNLETIDQTYIDNFTISFNRVSADGETFSQEYSKISNDIRIERIGLTTEYSTYFGNSSYSNFPYNYTDLALLSSDANPFPTASYNSIDFVDTKEEYERAINSSYLYIAGFPKNNKKENVDNNGEIKTTNFITAKFANSGDQKVYLSTSATEFGGLSTYRNPNNNKFWLDIFVNGEYTKPGYLSFASQLILPKLNIGGGSSGSMVCFYDEVDKKIKPLSIYWGVYERKVNNKVELVKGASDLFYTPSYHIGESVVPGYSSVFDLIWNGKTPL